MRAHAWVENLLAHVNASAPCESHMGSVLAQHMGLVYVVAARTFLIKYGSSDKEIVFLSVINLECSATRASL